MNRQIAHNIEYKSRTEDVQTVENVDFTAMLLSDAVLQGLLRNGFKKPSPIQLKAIPMGRCGYDLILQAKSGTGKTAVFGIIALEMIDVSKNEIQVLILAPTREIAVQIKEVLQSIGVNFEGLKVEYFIGGTNINDDLVKLKNCHIAVGAPGRIKHLIKDGHMKVDSVKLYVLDEADKLIATDQQKDINFIHNNLSNTKQMIASSATYPGDLKNFLSKYMQTPTFIDSQNDVPTLLGIRQFVTTVPNHLNVLQQMKIKTQELIRILQNVSFTQCIVFCNYQTRAETLSNNLSRENWPTTYISAAQNQKCRLEAVNSLKEFKCRILSTTDLTARGIDAANVDLVINYEVPIDSETYLHRMGRAGRYGSSGLCISIASEGAEVQKLQKLLGTISSALSVMKFPKENVPQDIWTCEIEQFEKLHATVDNKTDQICDTLKDLSVTSKDSCVETIKKDVTKENIVKTVESILENINKDDEISKESCKQKFNNMNPADIFEMLTKGETSKKENIVSDEINVQEILCNLNEQDESSKNELKNKFKNMDPATLLNLINDKIDDTTTSEESDIIKKSKCKKAKRNKNKKSNPDTENNEKFENEAKIFQENTIVNKNTALYQLTKVIVKQEPITEDSVTSTEELLKIMEQEDNIELKQQKTKLKFDDLLNKLGMADNAPIIGNWEVIYSETQNESPVIGNWEAVHSPIIGKWEVINPISQNKDTECACPENLFTKIYNSAISNSENNWLDSLCETHKNIESDNQKEESMQEEYYEEECEDYYEDCDEETEDNFESEENMEDVYVYDEGMMVKAYDYALKTKVQQPETSTETNSEQTYGYAASYKYDHLQPTKRKRKHNKKSKNREYKMEEDVNNLLTDDDAKYDSYFEYYNTMLEQNGPYFNNVQKFEEWFSQWQESVYGVRNFVQDEIYKKEKNVMESQ